MKIPTDIRDDEWLARYILYQKQIRRDGSDSIRPEAFIPHPRSELSVTRHLGLDESRIWKIGFDVACQRGRTLYGRADVIAANFTKHRLSVDADPILDPIPSNPNHANVSNWPADKSAQKMIAIEIAKDAGKAKIFMDGGS